MYACNIQISFQYSDIPSEAPLHDVESIELAIEDAMSGLLMELFGGTIIVNDVTIKYFLSEEECDE